MEGKIGILHEKCSYLESQSQCVLQDLFTKETSLSFEKLILCKKEKAFNFKCKPKVAGRGSLCEGRAGRPRTC